MLNAVIRFVLNHRLLTLMVAGGMTFYGFRAAEQLPIDVFPDLNRPRVTVLTEAPGLAPEEVETLITFPLETSVNGATGVQAVRSSSAAGLSVINVEFDWSTNPYLARQIVSEKIALASARLPAGTRPHLAPMSSIMGQVLQFGLWSDGGETSPVELRTLADWVVRQRLLAVPGVAQVAVLGGGRKQFQVLVRPESMVSYGVTLGEIEQAVAESNSNAAGGYVVRGPREFLVRSLGRVHSADDLAKTVVRRHGERPVLLDQVAQIVEAPEVKRGDAAVEGRPAVLMIVTKQPGSDTRALTQGVLTALDDLQVSLPDDVRIETEIYQQKRFIDLAIHNVIMALRDGSLLVVVILFLFLLNLRTTLITLTAIPLSLLFTALVFHWLELSINVMTLGGLAVAIGELVDDAVVDVENIFRRLSENRRLAEPRPVLRVVYEASSEVRNSIVFSTILVVLVFLPLLALGGIEGRLFKPLALAYIVSILGSLLVSLTVTPVLSSLLLLHSGESSHAGDGWLLRQLKRLAGLAIRFSLAHPRPILIGVAGAVVLSGVLASRLGQDFLPPFNEGSMQVNLFLPPGTSLDESNRIAGMAEEAIARVDGVLTFGRRTGRADQDEHVEGVNASEIIVAFRPERHRDRAAVLVDLRRELATVPGAVFSVEQPLAHQISHMLSGVKSQVGVKIFGDDLGQLRRLAGEVHQAMATVPGVRDLVTESQVEIPQIQLRVKREQLSTYALTVADVNRFVETAMNGQVVSEVVDGERKFDLLVRLDEPYRQDPSLLRRLSLTLPSGAKIPLSSVAEVVDTTGPNTIHRENVRRRIIVQCNTAGRDLGSFVADLRQALAPVTTSLPPGYFLELTGQFENQAEATRTIVLLSLVSLAGMFVALYTLFGSVSLSLQVLAALPMAAIGAVTALVVTGQSFTVASLVGFISLSGIASRNGILLLAHYLHLVRFEGESFSQTMIVRAGLERLAPMLMTALTAGIALVPLVLASDEPGKEILYPVATVILGGLISSTLLDFFVHPALFWLYGRSDAEAHLAAQTPLDALH